MSTFQVHVGFEVIIQFLLKMDFLSVYLRDDYTHSYEKNWKNHCLDWPNLA